MKIYFLVFLSLLAISLVSEESPMPNANAETMLLVHKTPTCGCCNKWIAHLKMSDFNVSTQNHESMEDIKKPMISSLNIDPVILVSQKMVIFLKAIFQANT